MTSYLPIYSGQNAEILKVSEPLKAKKIVIEESLD